MVVTLVVRALCQEALSSRPAVSPKYPFPHDTSSSVVLSASKLRFIYLNDVARTSDLPSYSIVKQVFRHTLSKRGKERSDCFDVGGN
jgi:hypothetical protein